MAAKSQSGIRFQLFDNQNNVIASSEYRESVLDFCSHYGRYATLQDVSFLELADCGDIVEELSDETGIPYEILFQQMLEYYEQKKQ